MATGDEIKEVTLEIWDNDWCGTDKSPSFQIRTKDGLTRKAYFCKTIFCIQKHTDAISKGDTLQWKDYKNLDGKSFNGLGTIKRFPMPGIWDRNYIEFKLFGRSGDDFCPKVFKVVTYDGTVYLGQMNDWVDKSKGYETRRAYQQL